MERALDLAGEIQPAGQRPATTACPDAVAVEPDMNKFAAVGRAVRATMLALTPTVEPLSIDEAFMDLPATEPGYRRRR